MSVMTESLPSFETTAPELSPVLIHLMKGVVYADTDPKLWAHLLRLQARVREYVQVIGLELVLDEAEGYAFLRSRNDEAEDPDEDAKPLPRLIARRRLSFPVSLLLALLRKRMAEADAGGGSTRLILTRTEIASLMRVFLAESSNEARIMDQIDAHIGKVIDHGFLRKLKTSSAQEEPGYEVLRILKAFVDAQWLAEFDSRLAEYARHAAGKETDDDA
jgi:hypothetical protein